MLFKKNQSNQQSSHNPVTEKINHHPYTGLTGTPKLILIANSPHTMDKEQSELVTLLCSTNHNNITNIPDLTS